MSKSKKATIAQPDPNSKRSKKRKVRGFKNLELSSRKHKRALRRLRPKLVVYGQILKPGEKKDNGPKTFMHTAGGAMKFW
jgi:hypothetical protein